jgi:hypothetical protein
MHKNIYLDCRLSSSCQRILGRNLNIRCNHDCFLFTAIAHKDQEMCNVEESQHYVVCNRRNHEIIDTLLQIRGTIKKIDSHIRVTYEIIEIPSPPGVPIISKNIPLTDWFT